MSKIKMDAVEVASSIHKGDFSKLHGKSFEMCDNLGMGKKYTLNQLGMTVDTLTITVDKLAKEMRNGFKQVNNRIDNLEKDINARLDYIVKANNLKDSK
ncbi:MAG: hypothetical protein MJ213_02880 [Bacilli bacterium]|nr:hypothetical protein [Bacilli bacterium]